MLDPRVVKNTMRTQFSSFTNVQPDDMSCFNDDGFMFVTSMHALVRYSFKVFSVHQHYLAIMDDANLIVPEDSPGYLIRILGGIERGLQMLNVSLLYIDAIEEQNASFWQERSYEFLKDDLRYKILSSSPLTRPTGSDARHYLSLYRQVTNPIEVISDMRTLRKRDTPRGGALN